MTEKVLIMMASYKRRESLKFALENLCRNSERDLYDVELVVGLNSSHREERDLLIDLRKLWESKQFTINYQEFSRNIGKAECLNKLYERHYRQQDFVLSIDNDIWIKQPWLKMLKWLHPVDYDIVGFGGQRLWAHTPNIGTDFERIGPFRLYRRTNICGMLMLYSNSFLENNRFGGYGGVYGGVDAYSCTLTEKKFVLFSEEDWIEHDPLKESTPELREYECRKRDMYAKKIFVFPEGWDEKCSE